MVCSHHRNSPPAHHQNLPPPLGWVGFPQSCPWVLSLSKMMAYVTVASLGQFGTAGRTGLLQGCPTEWLKI